MIDALLNALVSALLGVIAFVVAKQMILSQDTTRWSAAERAMVDVIPMAIAIMIVIGIFMGLTRLRGT